VSARGTLFVSESRLTCTAPPLMRSSDATHDDIDREVKEMGLGRINSFTTRGTLEMLKRRAYAPAQLERLAAESVFRTCAISTQGIGLEVRLTKEDQQ